MIHREFYPSFHINSPSNSQPYHPPPVSSCLVQSICRHTMHEHTVSILCCELDRPPPSPPSHAVALESWGYLPLKSLEAPSSTGASWCASWCTRSMIGSTWNSRHVWVPLRPSQSAGAGRDYLFVRRLAWRHTRDTTQQGSGFDRRIGGGPKSSDSRESPTRLVRITSATLLDPLWWNPTMGLDSASVQPTSRGSSIPVGRGVVCRVRRWYIGYGTHKISTKQTFRVACSDVFERACSLHHYLCICLPTLAPMTIPIQRTRDSIVAGQTD